MRGGRSRNEILPARRAARFGRRPSEPALPRTYIPIPGHTALGTIKALIDIVIDPPVTADERLADAMAAFEVLCDRALEYLDLLAWDDQVNIGSPGSSG